jgi:bacterioferritin
MQGDSTVIGYLNRVLGNELVGINQYFLHARMYKNWGLGRLGKHEYDESIGKMRRTDKLIERILFLEGLPNLQDLGHLKIGENPEEILGCDLQLELQGTALLREALEFCEKAGDYVSRELLEEVLEDEEEQIDWLETEAELVQKVGLQNYLQSQM